MRRWCSLYVVIFLLAVQPVLAQIEERPEVVPPKRSQTVKFGGGIGVAP